MVGVTTAAEAGVAAANNAAAATIAGCRMDWTFLSHGHAVKPGHCQSVRTLPLSPRSVNAAHVTYRMIATNESPTRIIDAANFPGARRSVSATSQTAATKLT